MDCENNWAGNDQWCHTHERNPVICQQEQIDALKLLKDEIAKALDCHPAYILETIQQLKGGLKEAEESDAESVKMYTSSRGREAEKDKQLIESNRLNREQHELLWDLTKYIHEPNIEGIFRLPVELDRRLLTACPLFTEDRIQTILQQTEKRSISTPKHEGAGLDLTKTFVCRELVDWGHGDVFECGNQLPCTNPIHAKKQQNEKREPE